MDYPICGQWETSTNRILVNKGLIKKLRSTLSKKGLRKILGKKAIKGDGVVIRWYNDFKSVPKNNLPGRTTHYTTTIWLGGSTLEKKDDYFKLIAETMCDYSKKHPELKLTQTNFF